MQQWQAILGWGNEEFADLRFVAYSYIKQGHYEIALKILNGLTVLTNNVYDVQTIGALHMELGDNGQALIYINKALSINPQHPPTLLNKAKILLVIGEIEEGLSIAGGLVGNENAKISDQAEALLLGYSSTHI